MTLPLLVQKEEGLNFSLAGPGPPGLPVFLRDVDLTGEL